MYKAYYETRRTMLQYDNEHIIGYLNETVVDDYVPEHYEGDTAPEPRKAYCYEGTEKDGGTIMPCEDMTNYHDVANAIIRSKYSESEELSIVRHKINGDDGSDSANNTEFSEFNAWCEQAKVIAKDWCGIKE